MLSADLSGANVWRFRGSRWSFTTVLKRPNWFARDCAPAAQSENFGPQTGPEKMSRRAPQPSFEAFFSGGALAVRFQCISRSALHICRLKSKQPRASALRTYPRWPERPRAKPQFYAAFRPLFHRFGCRAHRYTFWEVMIDSESERNCKRL